VIRFLKVVEVAVWLIAAPMAVAQTPTLVSTSDLATWLAEPGPQAGLVDRAPVHLLDVRQSWASYLQNHLPGAAWLNIETLRAQRAELPFQLLSGEQYADLFRRLGLQPDGLIVIYSAGDQLDIDATFAAWLLTSAGATRVYLLDGGYAKWEGEARTVTQIYPRGPVPAARFKPKHFRPAIASLEEVRAAAAGAGPLIVDARPPEQYAGTAGAQRRRGHIPGAVNHPWKDDLEKPDLALVWKPAEALRASYAAQGITPDRDIMLYCNSGTEASHVFFALKYLLGYPNVRIYVGSWTQWAERDDLTIER
jgi:thiosulfate/3-mercaptopyruvate sulfurtransferase